MLEITVNLPNYPKGTQLDIGGVLVENGSTTKLDEDAELSFVNRHRRAVRDQLEGNEHITVKGSAKYSTSDVEKLFPVGERVTGPNPYVEDVEEEETQEGGES